MPSHDGEDEILQCILEANGISEETLSNRPESIKSIEMFLFSLPEMRALHYFPYLVSLAIMQQDISEIKGLEKCTALEMLWLNENCITRITGLDQCVHLKRLYLHSNQISKIENLENLEELQTLWLSENKIQRIEGMETLTQLKSLWLAQNCIDRIGDSLDRNVALEELHLSDNRIGCFKEVTNLCRLPQLRTLSLSDPHWGENAVCSLCNYHTYVLYHLPGLTNLDGLILTEEARQLAHATYMKKKMYYNMRIKTLKRNTSNVVRRGLEAKTARQAQVQGALSSLVRQQKDIERELDERRLSPSAAASANSLSEGALQERLRQLELRIVQQRHESEEMEQRFRDFRDEVLLQSEDGVARLYLELGTGGNIRLEDGRPEEVWYSSCVDLVSSRFCAADYTGFGVADVRVLRVTRIHNRFLRTRFENKVETLTDISDPAYKRSLEYLFYGEHPQLPNDLQMIGEEGFPSPREYATLGAHAAVPLSNSLSATDMPRLKARPPKASDGPIPGRLLIAKVFLGKTEAEVAPSPRDGTATATAATLISSEAFPDVQAVYRAKPGDPKQRMWFILDNSLVLPEYLIEFEYLLRPSAATEAAVSVTGHSDWSQVGLQQPQSDMEAMDMASCIRTLASYLRPTTQSIKDGEHGTGTGGSKEPNGVPVANGDDLMMPSRPKVFLITDEILLRAGRTTIVSNISYLNLHGNNIRRMEGLTSLANLRTLILSFNEIQRIEGMDTLLHLERLDLSYNQIKRIESLKPVLTALTDLDLSSNALHRIEDISTLNKHMPQLTEVDLSCNPLCDVKEYRLLVVRRLPHLDALDGVPVTLNEKAEAENSQAEVTMDLIREHGILSSSAQPPAPLPSASQTLSARTFTSTTSSSTNRSIRSSKSNVSVAAAAKNSTGHPLPIEKVTAVANGVPEHSSDIVFTQIDELDLEHRGLRHIQLLDKIPNLRRVSFSDNELSHITGFDTCTALEELRLEENRISRIEGLGACTSLRKLELGRNRIGRIENVNHLTMLTLLSLEDNAITSLFGLETLASLMELYVGNNRVAEAREVQHLKDLPKLIILDLSGNPLCSDPEYRPQTVYHLKKLKVLDGVGVDAAEQTAAREKYSGRLTVELLIDKVGHRFFEHVRELDLSGCRVRDVQVLSGSSPSTSTNSNTATASPTPAVDDFCSLRDLSLDNNLISDITPLARLTTLVSLHLSHNRLEPSATPSVGSTLGVLTGLEVLHLAYNNISTIPSLNLYTLPSLRVLVLSGNEIVKIEGLHSLSTLQELHLDRNKIKFIEAAALVSLANLRELHLEENGLRTLANIGPLARLQSLFLSGNRISDLQDFEKVTGLPSLTELVMLNTPVARKSMYRPTVVRKLPTLRSLDLREVSIEERERIEVLFSGDPRYQMTGGTAAASLPPGTLSLISGAPPAPVAGKVPIKLTSMSFPDSLSAIPLSSPAAGPTYVAGGGFASGVGGGGTAIGLYAAGGKDFELHNGQYGNDSNGNGTGPVTVISMMKADMYRGGAKGTGNAASSSRPASSDRQDNRGRAAERTLDLSSNRSRSRSLVRNTGHRS